MALQGLNWSGHIPKQPRAGPGGIQKRQSNQELFEKKGIFPALRGPLDPWTPGRSPSLAWEGEPGLGSAGARTGSWIGFRVCRPKSLLLCQTRPELRVEVSARRAPSALGLPKTHFLGMPLRNAETLFSEEAQGRRLLRAAVTSPPFPDPQACGLLSGHG